MKKILLLIFFVILSKATYSQSENQTNEGDLIIMTKAKHEALRRDIEDYKLLLIKYQSLRIEQETLVADLDRQSKLLESKAETLDASRKRVDYLESEIATLRIQIEQQQKKIGDMEAVYRNMYRNYYLEKGKVYRMQKGQANLRMWQGAAVFFFLAMLVVGSQ